VLFECRAALRAGGGRAPGWRCGLLLLLLPCHVLPCGCCYSYSIGRFPLGPGGSLTSLTKGSSCRRNAKLICNGHGMCGTYVPRHCSPIVVWTHSNDCVAIHTHVGYEM
jgi:hypothetical protein